LRREQRFIEYYQENIKEKTMKGKCPKCGASYYGWALENPLHQRCEQCGSSLEISEGQICTGTSYSVLSYLEYRINRNRMKETMTIN